MHSSRNRIQRDSEVMRWPPIRYRKPGSVMKDMKHYVARVDYVDSDNVAFKFWPSNWRQHKKFDHEVPEYLIGSMDVTLNTADKRVTSKGKFHEGDAVEIFIWVEDGVERGHIQHLKTKPLTPTQMKTAKKIVRALKKELRRMEAVKT
jgi:hypothetical protein